MLLEGCLSSAPPPACAEFHLADPDPVSVTCARSNTRDTLGSVRVLTFGIGSICNWFFLKASTVLA